MRWMPGPVSFTQRNRAAAAASTGSRGSVSAELVDVFISVCTGGGDISSIGWLTPMFGIGVPGPTWRAGEVDQPAWRVRFPRVV